MDYRRNSNQIICNDVPQLARIVAEFSSLNSSVTCLRHRAFRATDHLLVNLGAPDLHLFHTQAALFKEAHQMVTGSLRPCRCPD
jgi:hypothetical protein